MQALLTEAGIEDVSIVNYGVPITEWTRRLPNCLIRGDRGYEGLTPEQRSILRAQAKPKTINQVLSLVGGNVILPFRGVQRWFYRHDLGDGYVACGVKRPD